MKTIIDQMSRQLAQQQAADDSIVSKCKSLSSFTDRLAQARRERDDALIAAIKDDQTAFLGELRNIQAELAGIVRDIQGPTIEVEHRATALQAAE